MQRKNCADMFKVIDTMDYVRAERTRLTGIVNSKQYKTNKDWWWMEKWLNKSDEEHYAELTKIESYDDKEEDYIESAYHCSICFKTPRKLLVSTFSFCDEYGCRMNICKECATKISKLAKTM